METPSNPYNQDLQLTTAWQGVPEHGNFVSYVTIWRFCSNITLAHIIDTELTCYLHFLIQTMYKSFHILHNSNKTVNIDVFTSHYLKHPLYLKNQASTVHFNLILQLTKEMGHISLL